MQSNDLFTAPQLAKLCSTDLKTIHNWVSRGEIKFFRTPGRHLRFRRDDIVEFLTKFGYPVPDGFSAARRSVVVIDGAASSREQIARAIGTEIDVLAFSDCLDAAVAIGRQAPSIVCINADDGPEAVHAANRLAVCAAQSKVVVYGAAVEPGALDEALLTIKPGDCGEIGRVVRSLLKSS
jgi:excisionase family DNA binding protein